MAILGFERSATRLRRKRWEAVTTPPKMAPATPSVTMSCPVRYKFPIGVFGRSDRTRKRSGVALNP